MLNEKKFATSVDMSDETLTEMIKMLNEHLATTSDLFTQTKQAHWNVKGLNFYALHLLFDELAEQVEGYVDDIAERVTALGGYAMGTARMAAGNTTLPEWPTDITEGEEFVAALLARYSQTVAATRAAIDIADQAGDMATSDLYTEITRGLDKSIYFLQAHLQS